MTTSPYIHPVPVGATIPAGTKYAAVMDRNHDFTHGGADDYPRFTADPIPAPRPAPPTEPGTVLLDVTANGGIRTRNWERGHYCPEVNRRYPWLLCAEGDHQWYATDDLVSWTVADVTPRKPDPLDENDHRDRIDKGGRLWRRQRSGRWNLEPVVGDDFTLAYAADGNGPFRFADEADQS